VSCAQWFTPWQCDACPSSLNFGSKARAEQYLAQKLAKGLPGAEVKSFEVPSSFLEELRASAVTERQLSLDPSLAGRPLRVDITKAPDQFGVRPAQIEALEKAIVQGSGRVGIE
jgi:filamentous hemagglutinin